MDMLRRLLDARRGGCEWSARTGSSSEFFKVVAVEG
jgi:hypothetical protein